MKRKCKVCEKIGYCNNDKFRIMRKSWNNAARKFDYYCASCWHEMFEEGLEETKLWAKK